MTKFECIRNIVRNNTFLLKIYSYFCKQEREEIKSYLKNIPQESPCQQIDEKKLARDLKFCKKRYFINANEYFRYRFYLLSEYGRKQYIGDYESDLFLKEISDKETWKIIKNKYLSYCKLKDYYKRDVIKIDSKNDYDIFCDFCKKHPNFIVKPIGMHAGIGVHKVHIGKTDTVLTVFNNIIGNDAAVVEELIEQGDCLAIFHPKSINTIRIVTFNFENKIEILQASIRMGMGDADIDSGAISASIDTNKGIISSIGRGSKNQQLYVQHPDSQVVIPGYKIPYWGDLISLSQTLSQEFPKQKIIGWDFSFSKKGWVVVEVNTMPAIQVLSGNGIGARYVYEKICNKINIFK